MREGEQVPHPRLRQVGAAEGEADPGERGLVGEDEVQRGVRRLELGLKGLQGAEAVVGLSSRALCATPTF
jgi:hypothetical protein